MKQALRPCPWPGCPDLTDRPKGCARHRATDPATTIYNAAWRTFARAYLRGHPTCEVCRRRPAREVHHPDSVALAPQRRLDHTNAIALCHDCHRQATPTVRSDGAFSRRRTR